MLTLYLVSAIVAGVLILLSIFGAGDHEFGHDADVHFDHGDADHDSDHGLAIGSWIPFFSLRFYTYFSAGLGATGLLLTFLTDANQATILIASLIVAAICGLGVWFAMKLMRRSESSSTATEKDMLGKEATVLVAINGRNPGRIRCTVKGDIIDYLAFSEDETPISPGESVVVIAMEEGRAQVVARESIFGAPEALPTKTS